jgi:hypothetical protein
MMLPPPPFAPIAPGETDNFIFSFTEDLGAASLVSTTWTCTLGPGQSPNVDPDPQSRILSAGVQTMIVITDPLTEEPLTKYGGFSVALVGNFPTTADGATYVLTAVVELTDGRTLSLSQSVLCSSTQAP